MPQRQIMLNRRVGAFNLLGLLSMLSPTASRLAPAADQRELDTQKAALTDVIMDRTAMLRGVS